MAFFTVIVPLYNKENYVAQTLESILAQTFTDFEVVVVDDCSKDSSLAIAKKFESDKIRIVSHDTNKGLSASRNTGIRNAKSDFVTFLDADDVWKPFFLEKMHAMIGLFPDAGIFGAGYEEYYPGNLALEVRKNLKGFAAGEMKIVPDFFTASSNQPIYCYSTVVFKKEVFETAGYFDEGISLGEDIDFNIRVHLKYDLAYYNRACAHYVIFSENQITNSGIGKNTITDFNKYEPFTTEKPSLKLYMDVNRYMLAMHYKMAGNNSKCDELVSAIDKQNLTPSQKFLLKSPVMIVKLVKKTKALFLKKGIRLTTFKG
ncbi:MAG TPA: glycosyltransferase family A protein [Flavobacterium sp.]|nr:glycosyltransferase family A protein [Flavobacterium sp.]